jgi:hypothetical protein
MSEKLDAINMWALGARCRDYLSLKNFLRIGPDARTA